MGVYECECAGSAAAAAARVSCSGETVVGGEESEGGALSGLGVFSGRGAGDVGGGYTDEARRDGVRTCLWI